MRRLAAIVCASALIAAVACSDDPPPESSTLHVLASSELDDMRPILEEAEAATDVRVVMTFSGSLSGASRIASGIAGDAAWFASDAYVALADASPRVLAQRSTMLSPVVVGVRRSVARRLGWTSRNSVGWREVAEAAANGRFRYAMANPTVSNSGFSALVGIANAYAGGEPLEASSIDAEASRNFLKGRRLSAGSSGDLADGYVRKQQGMDGIINYESVLIEINRGGELAEQLEIVYPDEGIVTADYPLMLLNEAKREAFDKLVGYLRESGTQTGIQRLTSRRPADSRVPLDDRFGGDLLVEAPFPANLSTVRALIDTYPRERGGAHTFYVLDLSETMDGRRLQALKDALKGLAGLDDTFSGIYTKFAPGERVTLIPFSTVVDDTREFTVSSADAGSEGLVALRKYIDGLEANGNSAIYRALIHAYELAVKAKTADPDVEPEIVLVTDGKSNFGPDFADFLGVLKGYPRDLRRLGVSVVFFGDADADELGELADVTGGKVFDARGAALAEGLKEIRGYE